MTALAFCTVTASTKRSEDLGSGRKGAPIANLASVAVTPLWPLQPETVRELNINSPREYKECYHVPAAGASLPDILERDVLTHGGSDYIVYSVAEWSDISGGVPCLRVVVQQVKGT